MTFKVVFLGTGAAIPSPDRGATSQFLDIHGHRYLIDAGEGVQLALRKNRCSFQKLQGIFISHMHGDHVLGLPGLLSTMSMLGRKDAISIWGPPGLRDWVLRTQSATFSHMTFDLEFHEWSAEGGDAVVEKHYLISGIPVKHKVPCWGLRVQEHSLPWKLDGTKAKKAGLPYNLRKKLKEGKTIEWQGETQPASLWCNPPIKPRSYVYSADSRPCQKLKEHANGATLLYHDATFIEMDGEKAKGTGHSTALEAARLASQAGVRDLVLGHLSQRYRDPEALLSEACNVHDKVHLATDGMIWNL